MISVILSTLHFLIIFDDVNHQTNAKQYQDLDFPEFRDVIWLLRDNKDDCAIFYCISMFIYTYKTAKFALLVYLPSFAYNALFSFNDCYS